jgi:hypothetical protein
MSVTAKKSGEVVTVVACVRATGVFMPPYVIFKGKNLKQEFRDGLPPGTAVSMSKSGYIIVEIFHSIKHFVSLKPQGNKPNILLPDGNSARTEAFPILCSTLWITSSGSEFCGYSWNFIRGWAHSL